MVDNVLFIIVSSSILVEKVSLSTNSKKKYKL